MTMSGARAYDDEAEERSVIQRGTVEIGDPVQRVDYTVIVYYEYNAYGHAEICEVDVERAFVDGIEPQEYTQELIDAINAHATKHFRPN